MGTQDILDDNNFPTLVRKIKKYHKRIDTSSSTIRAIKKIKFVD